MFQKILRKVLFFCVARCHLCKKDVFNWYEWPNGHKYCATCYQGLRYLLIVRQEFGKE